MGETGTVRSQDMREWLPDAGAGLPETGALK